MPPNPYESPHEAGTETTGIPRDAERLFLFGGALATLAATVFVLAWFFVYAIQELRWPLGDFIGMIAYFNSVLPFGPAFLGIGALTMLIVGSLKWLRFC